MADEADSDAGKDAAAWSDEKRARHSLACKDKTRLNLGDKLEIVRRNTELHPDDPNFRTQAQLAVMFGKSRAAISKIVRPENIKKLKLKAAAGLDPTLKRHTWRDWSHAHMELEERVINYAAEIQKRGMQCSSAQVCRRAVEIAQELGLDNFKTKSGWYAWYARLQRRQDQTAARSASDQQHPPQKPLLLERDLSAGLGLKADGGLKAEPLPTGPTMSLRPAIAISRPDALQGDPSSRMLLPDLQKHEPPQSTNGQSWTHCRDLTGHQFSQNSRCFSTTDQKYQAHHIRAVHVKTAFFGSAGPPVFRRLCVEFDMSSRGVPVEGFRRFLHIVCTAHREEFREAEEPACMYYLDEEQDLISISSDHELGVALEFFKCLPPLDTPLISWDNCSALRVFISGFESHRAFEVAIRWSYRRISACLRKLAAVVRRERALAYVRALVPSAPPRSVIKITRGHLEQGTHKHTRCFQQARSELSRLSRARFRRLPCRVAV